MTAAHTFDVVVVGSCMTDLITTVPRMPQLGETLAGTSFSTGFGGKGANQAVMAARLGADVAMVARLGDDVFGRTTVDNFAREGVHHEFVEIVEGVASGVAPITVQEDGRNIVLIVAGANDLMNDSAVEEAASVIRNARVVLCQLEIPDAAILSAFRIARRQGVRTILNPAPARPVSDQVLELADVIVPNETELHSLTGCTTDTIENVHAGALDMRKRPDQLVIITLGDRGAMVLDGDSMYIEPARRVRAVDSTGAGDAFIGTLAFLLARQVAVREAVSFSCRVATESVQAAGTQTSFPRADALRARGIDVPVSR